MNQAKVVRFTLIASGALLLWSLSKRRLHAGNDPVTVVGDKVYQMIPLDPAPAPATDLRMTPPMPIITDYNF